MAAGARITITTDKQTYVLYDTVDNLPNIDSNGTTARYELRRAGVAMYGGRKYANFIEAMRQFYRMIRFYENRSG